MQKIKSPKTGRLIKVGGPAYKQLLATYSKEQLLGLPLLQPDLTLPNDILYNLLLNSDIDTVQHLCFTNRYLKGKCEQQEFWIDLFKSHHLPLFFEPDSVKKWVDLFKKTEKAIKEAKQILTALNYLNINKFNVHFETRDDFEFFINEMLEIPYRNYMRDFDIVINHDQFDMILIRFGDDFQFYKSTFHFSREPIEVFLSRILYVSDDVKIRFTYPGDIFYNSIRIKDLLKLSKSKSVKNQKRIRESKEILSLL